jgi:hypothetical protein
MKRIAVITCLLALSAIAADEINVTAVLKVENANFSLTRQVSAYQVTQQGKSADYGIQFVTTTNSLVNAPNLNAEGLTPRYSFWRNLSTNNNVYVTVTMLLRSNDVAVLPIASTNVMLMTTGGTARLEYWLNAQ